MPRIAYFLIPLIDTIDNFQRIQISHAHHIWPQSYIITILLVKFVQSLFSMAICNVNESPQIGQFCEKWTWDSANPRLEVIGSQIKCGEKE